MRRSRYYCVLILLLLSACHSRYPQPANQYMVAFADGYYQLYPGWPAPARQLLQHIVWHSAQGTQEFLLSAMLTEQQILLIATSALGHELWRLQYSQQGIVQLNGIEPFNQPEIALRILAEMQLALLPLPVIQPRLHQLQLTEQYTGQYQRQLLNHQQQTLLDIYWQEPAEIPTQVNIQQQYYQLTITTLQQELLP
ncbi:DUF3261 domain-containing protein [Chromatiaceae bacterium AAb-1]|nr:DUF3261 domain-containing protein [Chromatiaceae bacterium AAb-1]